MLAVETSRRKGARAELPSMLAGALWGLVAVAIAPEGMRSTVWAGVAASPLIGCAIGRLVRYVPVTGVAGVTLSSLGALYLGAALFGGAIGVYRACVGDIGPGTETSLSVIGGSVLVVPYGMTVSGHVLWLWPMALVTSLLVRHMDR